METACQCSDTGTQLQKCFKWKLIPSPVPWNLDRRFPLYDAMNSTGFVNGSRTFSECLMQKTISIASKTYFLRMCELTDSLKKLVRHWLARKENTKLSRSILIILFSNNQRLWNGFAETVSINYSNSYVHQQIIYQIIYFNKNKKSSTYLIT